VISQIGDRVKEKAGRSNIHPARISVRRKKK
jgi:hypothetical protein